MIFKQRLEGASCDPLWEKSICGERGHIACKRVQFRAQGGAPLSEDASLVSSGTLEDMKGNLLSPVREKVWGGFQAQLDSGVQMMTSVFYHFSALPSSSGKDYLSCFSQRKSWAGVVLGWCGSCGHPWPSHCCWGGGMM